MKRQSFIFLLVLIAIASCRKDDPQPEESRADESPLEILAAMDNLPDAGDVEPGEIILPNGMNLESYLEETDSLFAETWLRSGDAYEGMTSSQALTHMIARLSAAAWNLCNRSLYQYGEEGPGKPKQNGLAYSWGSKNHAIRQKPPGLGAKCDHAIYGLDCSGFMYQIFQVAAIDIPTGRANEQRKPETLNKALEEASPALKGVTFKDLGLLEDVQELRIGDIVYWKESDGSVSHIGIVLVNQLGNKLVFQSLGRNSGEAGQCEKNLGLLRGPRGVYFDDPGGKSLYNNCYVVRAEACGCTSGSVLCSAPPTQEAIMQGLNGFTFSPGPGTKAEAKSILQYLCADLLHEGDYPDGVFYVCGLLPTGYEITLWSPTYLKDDRYGVRFGKVLDYHAHFSSNTTYFEIIKP